MIFRRLWRCLVRWQRRLRSVCEVCADQEDYCDLDGYACPECCDHPDGFDPNEGNHCLHCGFDGSEHLMAQAYDRYKDFQKYGA